MITSAKSIYLNNCVKSEMLFLTWPKLSFPCSNIPRVDLESPIEGEIERSPDPCTIIYSYELLQENEIMQKLVDAKPNIVPDVSGNVINSSSTAVQGWFSIAVGAKNRKAMDIANSGSLFSYVCLFWEMTSTTIFEFSEK